MMIRANELGNKEDRVAYIGMLINLLSTNYAVSYAKLGKLIGYSGSYISDIARMDKVLSDNKISVLEDALLDIYQPILETEIPDDIELVYGMLDSYKENIKL